MEQFKALFKKYFNRKVLLTYVYGAFASRFLGFIVSMWAVGLVAHFFEYPSFKNLWGLKSHKAMVSKETFENLKWIAQVVIGFFVFEIFHKTVYSKITEHAPEYYKKGIDYLNEKGVPEKARNMKEVAINQLKEKTLIVKEKIENRNN